VKSVGCDSKSRLTKSLFGDVDVVDEEVDVVDEEVDVVVVVAQSGTVVPISP